MWTEDLPGYNIPMNDEYGGFLFETNDAVCFIWCVDNTRLRAGAWRWYTNKKAAFTAAAKMEDKPTEYEKISICDCNKLPF